MTGRRLESGGTWIDRSRPIRFAFDGRDVDGFAGDTVASALLASGERAGFVSPLQGRARGIVTAGVEEPNAFVEISEPWFEPIRPATMVNVVDGLRVASRAGVGLLPDAPIDPRPARHVHRHVEMLVIGAGAAGRVAALEAAALNGRVLLVDEHHIVLEPPAGVTTLANTTASGIYDDGYVLCYQRDGAHERDPPRPRRAGRARRRGARAAVGVRRQRPTRRDARFGRPGLPRPLRCAGRAARRRVLHEPCRSRDRRGAARCRRPGGRSSTPPRRWGRRASACAPPGSRCTATPRWSRPAATPRCARSRCSAPTDTARPCWRTSSR